MTRALVWLAVAAACSSNAPRPRHDVVEDKPPPHVDTTPVVHRHPSHEHAHGSHPHPASDHHHHPHPHPHLAGVKHHHPF